MLLEVAGVHKTYDAKDGPFTALAGVGLNVAAGEIVGLIGTSGSGKSTLADVVVGLEAADEGRIEFNGASCDASVPMRKRSREFRQAMTQMQMVFQHPASSFSERMRIGQGVAEGVAYCGVSKGECEARALDALQQVGLPRAYAGKYAWELSGGECQRAALARAIVGNPKLLVCDEPTSALDVTVQARIVELLRDIRRERNATYLFICHDIALVQAFCDRVVVMSRGKLVEEGIPDDVIANPLEEYTKNLIASIL